MSLRDQGYLDETLSAFDDAIEARSGLVLLAPHDQDGFSGEAAKNRLDLSSAFLEKANVLARQGDLGNSLPNYEHALSLRLEIVDRTPAGSKELNKKRLDVTEVMVDYAEALGLAGRKTEQLDNLQRVLLERRLLQQLEPENQLFKRYLAWVNISLGELQLEEGFSRRALELFSDARGIQSALFEKDKENTKRQKDLAWAEGHLSDALLGEGRVDEAIAGYAKAITIAEKTLANEKDKLNQARHRDVAFWLTRRAKALRVAKRTVEAKEDVVRSINLMRNFVGMDESNRKLRGEYALAFLELGRVEAAEGDINSANERFDKAAKHLDKLARERPEVQSWTKRHSDAEQEAKMLKEGGG